MLSNVRKTATRLHLNGCLIQTLCHIRATVQAVHHTGNTEIIKEFVQFLMNKLTGKSLKMGYLIT